MKEFKNEYEASDIISQLTNDLPNGLDVRLILRYFFDGSEIQNEKINEKELRDLLVYVKAFGNGQTSHEIDFVKFKEYMLAPETLSKFVKAFRLGINEELKNCPPITFSNRKQFKKEYGSHYSFFAPVHDRTRVSTGQILLVTQASVISEVMSCNELINLSGVIQLSLTRLPGEMSNWASIG